MPETKGQNFQDVNIAALIKLGTAARATNETIMGAVNTEFDAPLRLAASSPADAKLNFAAQEVLTADGAGTSTPTIKGTIPTVVVSTIDFQTQATTGATFNITFPTTVIGKFYRLGFTLLTDSSITANFSIEAATVGALVNPGTLFATGTELGWIDLEATSTDGKFKTAGSSTSIIENGVGGTARVVRLPSGGGGAAGNTISSSDLVTFTAETTKSVDTGIKNINSEKSMIQVLDINDSFKDVTNSFNINRTDGDTIKLTTGKAITGTFRVVYYETQAGEDSAFLDVSFDGIVATKTVDITSTNLNAQKSVKQLLDNADSFKDITNTVDVKAPTTTSVKIDTGIALPSGTYRLLLKEVE